jgi:nicotinamidase/pyrazinamidase
MRISLQPGDALVLVDMQVDFVSGSAAVPGATRIIPVLNRYIARFEREGHAVIATRDWHPEMHVSFETFGGTWPRHCVAGTAGAEFDPRLAVKADTIMVSKGKHPGKEAYSAFDGSSLAILLQSLDVKRLFVGGLATDHCVHDTVRDALRHGFAVFLLQDAIRAVNAQPDDGVAAERAMVRSGATAIRFEDLDIVPEPASAE